MSYSILRDYRIQHSSPDGILVQLTGQTGFGRLTKATLGDDKLAERLLKYFATRQHIPAELCRGRDGEGYRLLTVLLPVVWPPIAVYPAAVQQLATTLLRKHIMVGLGGTMMAKIVRSSAKGTVFNTASWTALAVLEDAAPQAGDSGSSLEVRVLNYDVEHHVVHVTAKPDVVQRTPADHTTTVAALTQLQAGSQVNAHVLLSTTDDNCAVVEIPIVLQEGEETIHASVLGYYIYQWPNEAQQASPPVVGSIVPVTVEFAPPFAALHEVMPFFIVSQRRCFAHLPSIRSTFHALEQQSGSTPDFEHDPALGLRGYMPWREEERLLLRRRDDSDDDEADDGADGKVAKVSRRKYEEDLDAFERAWETTVPTSPTEFERHLLETPNSSYLWTQYMAYHVSLQQYELARQVADKALRTIHPRELNELFNVWIAYLNVENLYGTAESLNSVFKRALQRQVEPLKLYERLADIFSASGKEEQLLTTCKTMVSQFRTELRVWQRLGVVLVQQGKRDALKKMLKEMSGTLKRDEIALVIVHIAIYEYKNGSVENGRALMEGLLGRMPKKADVWSTFIDQELGLLTRQRSEGSVMLTRDIFNRAVATNFSATVMQRFLSRFLAFEKAHGTEKDVEKVKETARAYVESKIHSIADTTGVQS
ncbi:rRNA biogenesis protein RRP5 [Angomonas deanei]|nr:rRNA biogenesis protein RRP5 [Angomonas deanei]|eukprot:EPY34925.1 rRNA biogenesis protein RRP5 [Angomonas deanei]